MNKWQEMVREFHRDVLKQPHSLAEPKLRSPELRARLILEEAVETAVALVGRNAAMRMLIREAERAPVGDRPNLVEAIDGCVDTIVVCLGTLEDIGVDGDPFMDEIHRSNMAKAGGPIDAQGKQLKPPGWTPPDVAGVLARVTVGPPPLACCGCDGAVDDGCYHCTPERWRCKVCAFPLARVEGVLACPHCAGDVYTAEQWRAISFSGRLP